jgi:molecular chaperone GrpE
MTKEKKEKPKVEKTVTPNLESTTNEPSEDDPLLILKEELASLKDKYFRSLADVENFKKRNADELKREKKYASMTVCDKLIDSIEVFDQALGIQTEDQNFKNFLYGFKMIKDMIYQVLVDEGVTVIEMKEGDFFNPNIAHAFESEFDETKPDQTILKIVKKGYQYKDRLLRPAMVTINVYPELQDEEINDEEQKEEPIQEADEALVA